MRYREINSHIQGPRLVASMLNDVLIIFWLIFVHYFKRNLCLINPNCVCDNGPDFTVVVYRFLLMS